MFKDKTILITGGTGSFGNAFVRRMLDREFGEIRILSRDEAKQDLMRRHYGRADLRFHLGDVRDPFSVDKAMEGVDLVFHAAALKQVPSCEFFPMQAVMTNIVGSANVVDSAIRHGVTTVVCLSTDKAVFPVNAMGMTKALMEKVATASARIQQGTTVCAVRYGNVLYSRGSVIPLFVEQIRAGRPLTVTDAAMTRFMLPLPRAVDLVEFALSHANSGDLLIRKAPASTVTDVVDGLQHLFGTELPVEVIGVRHGEKLAETLATREELGRAEEFDDYFRISMDDRDLNYAKYFEEGDAREQQRDDYTSDNTRRLDLQETTELLASLPEVRGELEDAGIEPPPVPTDVP